MPSEAHGLYIHMPFCARRCDYCDFFVVIGQAREDFLEALIADLALAARGMPGDAPRLDTIYIGGGTPSSVDPSWIGRLLERCGRSFAVDAGAEITLEANPETVTAARARAWLAAGVNRLSVGVQSFDDRVLAPRGRMYTGDEAETAAGIARDAGFINLGLDLIGGLPGETLGGFLAGVERAVGLAPDHVSVYLLETEESGKRTPLSRAIDAGRESVPGDEETASMYEGAVLLLASGGLPRYEISNFAREGRRSAHNMKYWRSEPWAGVGPSAHSYIGQRRFARPADMDRWRSWVASGGDGQGVEEYTLDSAGQRAREALVLALRLSEGVDLAAFARRWNLDPRTELGGAIDDLGAAGLVASAGDRLALTDRGYLLSNEVFTRLT